MQHLRQHILFKSISLLLVLGVLLPSVDKLLHAFEHSTHKHEVCLGEKQTHLHTLDVDCEFHKFQINTAFTVPVNQFKLLEKKEGQQVIQSQYHFISDYQQLHFSLRGPPVIS